ncbi:unnamed protein product [Cunninghamella blakesleeana]
MLRLSNRRLTTTLCHSIKSRWVSTNNSNNVAYEEALKLINVDKRERLEMLSRVEKEVARVTKDTSSPTQTAQLAALNALKFDLQVKSELNDPEIRQNFDNNNVDMSRPVYRYLTERQFQKLPRKKLLERITQMNVMPDLVDLDINPTVDLRLKFANHDDIVEPGVFTLPEQSITLPNIELSNFHTETKLYTLLLVDPDSPDVENKTYQQYCHWLITNVPLSATESIVKGGNTILNYVPPHPQKGTKAHRYTFIAYEQTKELKGLENNQIQRDHFDVKSFAKQNELNVRGIHFFRQKWDESVSNIYKDILQIKEPIYGKPPRQEPYIQRTMYF